jgi:hypothetical protein
MSLVTFSVATALRPVDLLRLDIGEVSVDIQQCRLGSRNAAALTATAEARSSASVKAL